MAVARVNRLSRQPHALDTAAQLPAGRHFDFQITRDFNGKFCGWSQHHLSAPDDRVPPSVTKGCDVGLPTDAARPRQPIDRGLRRAQNLAASIGVKAASAFGHLHRHMVV
jgi:hypothetical protein